MHGCAGIAHRATSSRAARSRARAAAPHRVAPAAAAQTQPLLGARAEADGLAAPAVVLALASGALLALAAPPFDCSWLAWVALVPLLLGLPARPWPALVCGTVIGASLFLGVGYGLFAFSAGALLAVVVGLALLLGVVFGTASWLEQSPLPAWLRPLVLPSVWVIGERASTAAGAPWSIALTQTAHLPLLQSAALLGGFWIAFLVVLVNRAAAMLGVALLARRRGSDAGAGWRSAAALAGIATGGTLLFGAWTLSGDASGPALRVASIQPVIASELYRYQAMLPAARRQVRALVAQLSADALVARPDVLVWPEGGNGEFNFRVPALRQEIGALARASGAALLISSHDVDARGRLFNSVFSVLPSGAVAGRYDKVRLTPRGEEAFAAGRAWAPLPTVGGPVGALLCFESVLPQAARALVAQGARWLLITASDVAFRNSSLALLHARFAVLRAVENQRAVVQASNGGPSLVIAPSGAVRAQTALLARGAVTGTVPLRDEHTPYTRWGDAPLLALCGLVVAAALAQRPRRGGPRRRESGASAPRARGPGVGAVVGWLGVAVAAGLLLAVVSLLRTSAGAGSASDPLTAFLRPAAINWSPDAAQEFRQSAENTCGPAALAMLASYLGMNVHEREVVPLVALTPSGTSMAELAAAARRLGFGAWGERQDLAGLRTTPKPVIAHVAGNHYVVVLALSDAGVDLFDPAVGYRRLSPAEFTRVWQGHVLVVRFADDADTGWSR